MDYDRIRAAGEVAGTADRRIFARPAEGRGEAVGVGAALAVLRPAGGGLTPAACN